MGRKYTKRLSKRMNTKRKNTKSRLSKRRKHTLKSRVSNRRVYKRKVNKRKVNKKLGGMNATTTPSPEEIRIIIKEAKHWLEIDSVEENVFVLQSALEKNNPFLIIELLALGADYRTAKWMYEGNKGVIPWNKETDKTLVTFVLERETHLTIINTSAYLKEFNDKMREARIKLLSISTGGRVPAEAKHAKWKSELDDEKVMSVYTEFNGLWAKLEEILNSRLEEIYPDRTHKNLEARWKLLYSQFLQKQKKNAESSNDLLTLYLSYLDTKRY